MSHPLPHPLRVLAVSADDARHAPVRALLRTAAIEHVTTADAARKAHQDNGHDVTLVDRELARNLDGLTLAEELVQANPRTPVIVLSHAADKRADEAAADAGI